MRAIDIIALGCSGLAIVFSGLAIYFNWKARKLRREANEAYQRHREAMKRLWDAEAEAARSRRVERDLSFAKRYGAVTPAKLAETFPTNPPDPAAFGAFIASLPYEETEVKAVVSPPGPEAWVGHGGDFSGGGASGSWDAPSSDAGSSDTSSSGDSGSSDCGSSSDTSSSSGSCGVE